MTVSEIHVHQCLFGYDDGHRLIASSLPLGNEATALTELSDLAPGTIFSGSDGYWSGVPAPSIGRYALMRTWPAPEMPRPGCVWTHALLIEPAALGQLTDLAALTTLASRPTSQFDRERYRERLLFDPVRAPSQLVNKADREDVGVIAGLLEALYADADAAIAVPAPGRIDMEVFAVWSQQWPRLRRNFRFQTAVTRDARSSSAVRLDVSLRLGSAVGHATRIAGEQPWLDDAVLDAVAGGGRLREFLWRYGADVRKQRGSFRPLASISALSGGAELGSGAAILELITHSFPELEDAALLKQDVVDGVVVPGAQLDVLWYVLANGGDAVFPPPTEAGVSRLALLWPVRPDDLLNIAETTADGEEPLARAMFNTVTGAVPLADFWRLTASYPRVRYRMVEARPELLLSSDLAALDNTTVATLVSLAPTGSPIASELVSRLLPRDDVLLAETLTDRFPREVASQAIAAADGGTVHVGRAWIRGLVGRPEVILDPAVMGPITRTSLLHELGEALGWLTPAVLAGGTEPWIAALVDINSDLDDDRRDALRAFMVALALASGGDGGRRLLEKFFEAVHERILKSRLPWRASDILSPLLPELPWGRGWDFGLKLRLAVAAAYSAYEYPPSSFSTLAHGKKNRAMMADAARMIDGGKALVKVMEK